MSIKILIKKLYLIEKKFLTGDLLREYCQKLRIDYYSAIRYLLTNKYLYRVLRGIFYKPSIEERKLNKLDINHLELLADALKIKGISHWYCGLETAIKLNNLSHEHFTTDFIINDTLFRANPINMLGRKIKFIKLKKELCLFGIKKNKIRFSDIEKTVLDVIYLSKYGGLNDEEIKNKIADLLKYCSKNKLKKYSRKYNQTVSNFIRGVL